MYKYRAYGLGIHSTVPLPELVPLAEAQHDVSIRLGPLHSHFRDLNRETTFRFSENSAYLHWEGLGAFEVNGGKEIVIDPTHGADEDLVRLPLLGVVIAVLLHQRGFLVLHASAVSLGGGAVVFMAGKGAGKSTIAAALYARGHHLIADDVVAMTFSDAGPVVVPGIPLLKLWPDAAASSLGDDPQMLPRIAAHTDKRARRVFSGFSEHGTPLEGICALSRGPEPRLRRLAPRAAIMRLIANSYASRFGKHLLAGDAAALHLNRCGRLVESVPVYELERPDSLQSLSRTAELLEESMFPQLMSV